MEPMLIVSLILVCATLIPAAVDFTNYRHAAFGSLPAEFTDLFSQEEFKRSQKYLAAQTKLSIFEDVFGLAVTLAFLWAGGFAWLLFWSQDHGATPVWEGLLFFGAIGAAQMILGLPFAAWKTFRIEAEFGFNKTSPRTFVLDRVKGVAMTIVIGGPILGLVLWFFERWHGDAWWIVWLALTAVQILLGYVAPVFLLPLFNKFTTLSEGSLRQSIEDFARAQKFSLSGIFTMDGSKRSSKANAFFTGYGRFRRIVLFDTLVQKLTEAEVLAVLAHEVGHFKRRHIWKMLFVSIVVSGVGFYIAGGLLESDWLAEAFGVDHIVIFANLFFLSLLFAPASLAVSAVVQALSRAHEYEADAYAVAAVGNRADLASGLKKLALDSLANLNPHPWKVWLSYSHPPMVQRLGALRDSQKLAH